MDENIIDEPMRDEICGYKEFINGREWICIRRPHESKTIVGYHGVQEVPDHNMVVRFPYR